MALAGCGAEPAAPSARNVLLITLDTTRYNALGCYGNPARPSPALDALASESVVYENAHTVTPLTLPAHASMLTGLYPPRHTLYDNGIRALPRSATTLAELARAAGVQTAAFVAAVVLDHSLGLDQGFESYREPPRAEVTATGRWPELGAQQIVADAERWLAARDRSRPFFAWMHFFDAHGPYTPPQELVDAVGSPYLGEIASIDRALAPFLERLRADGTLATTTVIVVADHGEGLSAHGEATHGWYCYDSTLRVPFFVRHPDGARRGERSHEVVSVVDVFPTALAALGLPLPADVDGVDLTHSGVAPERGVYFELFKGYLSFGWSPLVGWIDAHGKYVHSSAPEFYALSVDPLERKNVIDESSERVSAALRAIARVRAARPLAPDADAADVGAELRDALRALGYVGLDESARPLPDPLAPHALPAPSARREELRLFNDGLQFAEDGKPEESVLALRALLELFPDNVLARVHLANGLIGLERTAEARELLESLAAEGHAHAGELNSLGWCREKAGDVAGALEAYRRALALDPEHPWAAQNLARLAPK